MADAYARFAIEFEADLSRVQTGMAQGLSWANQYGNDFAGGFSSGFVDGLRQVEGGVNLLTSLRGRFASTAQGISEIFGMQAGADMAYFRRQLTGMIGDAGQAEKALTSLVRIANTTNFGNADVMQMAASALGSGTSPQNLESEISSLLDASAAMGVRDMGTFRRMSRNFFDLRGKPGEANQRDVNELYRAAPQFVFQAAKVMGTSASGAREQIQSMSGSDLYDLIVQIGRQNQGTAAREGMADPFVAGANAVDQFNTAMAPTGELLNKFITPLIADAAALGGLFAQVNKAGMGVPGVILGIGMLRGGIYLYQQSMGRTILALNALANAATAAAAAQSRGSITAMGTSTAGSSSGIMAIAGKFSAAIVGAIAAYEAGKALGNMVAEKQFSNFSKPDENGRVPMTDEDAKKYAYLGWKHPATSPEVFENTVPAKKDPNSDAAKDLKEAAKALKDASATGYGYGARGQHVLSSVEAGYALLGAERLGVA